MRRTTGKATMLAYLGVVLLLVAYYPALQADGSRLLHAVWHVLFFFGAACLVYGLETLRTYARRYRRMTQ